MRLVKDATSQYPTLPFLAVRFALAAMVMAVVVHRLPPRRVLVVGIPIGVALAAGYLLQTVGLATTSPGNAAARCARVAGGPCAKSCCRPW